MVCSNKTIKTCVSGRDFILNYFNSISSRTWISETFFWLLQSYWVTWHGNELYNFTFYNLPWEGAVEMSGQGWSAFRLVPWFVSDKVWKKELISRENKITSYDLRHNYATQLKCRNKSHELKCINHFIWRSL